MKIPSFTPLDNLRGFALTRPPAVVFTLCLMLFAITLISLAYYVKVNEIENPDITKDWNAFLEHFTKNMEFCIDEEVKSVNVIVGNSTVEDDLTVSTMTADVDDNDKQADRWRRGDSSEIQSSTISVPPVPGDGDVSHWTAPPSLLDQGHSLATRNHSFPITIHITSENLGNIDKQFTSASGKPHRHAATSTSKLVTVLTAAHLKLTDFGDDDSIMSVTFGLLYNQSLSQCLLALHDPGSGEGGGGQGCTLQACVTFQGPAHIFPDISEKSAICSNISTLSPPAVPHMESVGAVGGSSGEEQVEISVRRKEVKSAVVFDQWCRRGAEMSVEYVGEPQVSVMIDVEDRSVINLHLMHTSYFVFVMIMTVFCFAIIRGSRPNAKIILIDKGSNDVSKGLK